MDTKGDLASVIRAVADGTPVEWSAFDGPADESVVSVLNQLRTIATIAGVHGTLNGSAAAPRPASPEPLQTWGPLTVLQRIGEGSYGVVYRAWDSRLDREVALKLLRTDHPGDGADSPAVHEGRLLARVRHPNVVTVYGADRIDGRTGIWMEFVDGRTLEEIVGAEGPLPSAEAQRIIQDLASGLAAVHDAGILHRDVKAQNVIRQDDGRVVLMDFGSGQSREEEQQQAAGTPLYVAPEVLGGAPASVQSDIYSLGVLLYYLLTWRYPRSGTTVAELKRLGPQAWPSLRELQPEVPANVSDAVDRALAPPQARLRTAREFEAAVRPHRRRRANIALVATLVCAAMLATGAWVMRHGAPSDSRPARVPAVIVARFDNDTGDPALSAFVEGTVERELGNAKLARPAPASRVASTLALMRHAPETRSELPVAREVAVRDGEIDAVIGGRVERVGSQLVVNVEAIDPADGALLASAADRAPSRTELTRVLRSQTVRLGQELATRIVPRLGGPPLNRVTTSSLTALRSYTQAALLMGDGGRQQWDNAAARRHLDDALRADPQFASAHLLLAWAILNDSRLCGPCPQVSEVLDHGDRALALLDGVTTVER
jgi:serine/threonine protein kinase